MSSLRFGAAIAITCLLLGCPDDPAPAPPGPPPHGPAAEGIYAPQGEPLPGISAAQREDFERGIEVGLRRFDKSSGLGPAFNVTFCLSCHERPVPGGSAGLYRNFFLAGTRLPDGSFVPATSAGKSGGVIRMYDHGYGGAPARPPVSEQINVIAQRNPIPFFGVGLLAELSDAELLRRADPDDADGDGISGRANYDQGFVGRFGRKSQTVSIEGFIRGPLFNHLGVTTDPLSEEQKSRLPVDSSTRQLARLGRALGPLRSLAQAAAPASPLTDEDPAPDPEMSTVDLFSLVTYAMLLAAPEPEELSAQGLRGRDVFDDLRCGACHAPRLEGPRGPLPIYSDLLLHDMGPELADGLVQGLASGSEFRTQPLWGLSSVGPYLHDGRAETIEQAILLHGGEGEAARDAAAALTPAEMADLVEFLSSLGGRSQRSSGLLPPDAPIPPVGGYGGPVEPLSGADLARFEAGRRVFDREHGFAGGLGGLRFNGDSCRACHFDPTIGGAGPRGVDVMRHGIANADGAFVPPAVGTVLHKGTALAEHANAPQAEANIFERRQTPHLFGLGLTDAISEAEIVSRADPDDTVVPDGISGRVSVVDGGRIGRFGWKAQVPSIEEFVRDAVTTELGMTLPWVEGLTYGRIHDNDAVPDPELTLEDADTLAFYLRKLGPPPRADAQGPEAVRGEQVFEEVGCAKCHVPALQGPAGPVPLYSDLLLHTILEEGALGIEEFSAGMREFRTAPLWGLSQTAPYFHDGRADTVAEAIASHDGEAQATRKAYEALSAEDQAALLAFLETL